MKPDTPASVRDRWNVPQVDIDLMDCAPIDRWRYPEYVMGELLKRGLGKIEADRALARDDTVDFVFTPQGWGQPEVVASLSVGYFSPVMSRFGPQCGCDDMLYGGHTLFACIHQREGAVKAYRFKLYTCNLNKVGCWLRLYLYNIDDNPRPVFESIE